MIDLDELERLEKAATPGPWEETLRPIQLPEDVMLCRKIRNALPALLECARALEILCIDENMYDPGGRASEALALLRG